MKEYLGIELGSTRIKAVAIDEYYIPTSQGDYGWASHYENGIWTYDLDEAWQGIKAALKSIENRGNIAAAGISGMMHGYLAFDRDWNLLTPFRTWQNTITAEAAEQLTAHFGFNIPQRWSIAHLYQAILNGEDHLSEIAHITTLAGYIHYRLTGINAVGIGEASGIFPIDSKTGGYHAEMIAKFNDLIAKSPYSWQVEDLLPKVYSAGEQAGSLTSDGAALLGDLLPAGIPFAPPEGDAGTGMVATNAIAPKTGNISAGTSIFSMIVLERPLKKVYPEVDLVCTPAGRDVAMVHCNNCTADSNAWIALLGEAATLLGADFSTDDLYSKLYRKSLEGDADCGDILVCNYLSGEGITHLNEGRPMVLRRPNSDFTLANFMRATLYSSIATLKLGMELLEEEQVKISSLVGHGGLFKTQGVAQRWMAAALDTPITCMETAGEGGPFGMALLAAFLFEDGSLESFLKERVFKATKKTTLSPHQVDQAGFLKWLKEYKKMLKIEQTAVEEL